MGYPNIYIFKYIYVSYCIVYICIYISEIFPICSTAIDFDGCSTAIDFDVYSTAIDFDGYKNTNIYYKTRRILQT